MTSIKTHSRAVSILAALLFAGVASTVLLAQQGPTQYVRYQRGSTISFGIKDGDVVRELRGDLFADPKPSGKTYKLAEVKLLTPLDWKRVTKIIGVGVNSAEPGKNKPVAHPILFAKLPQYLVSDGSEVPVFPESVGGLVYEAELVVVIGKNTRYASVEQARKNIFGFAIGNDLQEIDWWLNGTGTLKNGTRQPGHFLAKTQEGSAGIGPVILSGVDHNNLKISVRKNGKTISVGSTNQLLNTPEQVVSYISRYIELFPGDLIYMGCICAGRDLGHPNQKLFVGDKMEYELEHAGVLHQTMVAAKIPAGATTWPDGFADRMEITKMNMFPKPAKPEDTTPGAEE
jgi:2-keto-4-pentenoate hydratase/2-oxohepta-3-ene-1,7-dioic acid hydratase in catechol pathway